MKYPINFVYDVKDLFPTNRSVHEMLENGSPTVGRFLEDRISYWEALELGIDKESLKHISQDLMIARKLYLSYQEITSRQKDYAAPTTHFRSIPVR